MTLTERVKIMEGIVAVVCFAAIGFIIGIGL